MKTKRRKRHSSEQIIAKLLDVDAMHNDGKDLAVVLQTLETSQSTYEWWPVQYGGMRAEEDQASDGVGRREPATEVVGVRSVAGQPDAEVHQLGRLMRAIL